MVNHLGAMEELALDGFIHADACMFLKIVAGDHPLAKWAFLCGALIVCHCVVFAQ